MRISLSFHRGSLEKFERMVKKIPEDAHIGAVKGIELGLEVWEDATKQLAMVDTGNLQDEITSEDVEVTGDWLDLEGTIRNDAWDGFADDRGISNGYPFNYAYYWYQKNPGSTRSGGDPRAIDTAGQANTGVMISFIANEVKKSWIRAGW